MDQNVLYRGQRLILTRFWATGEPCLWITNPAQIGKMCIRDRYAPAAPLWTKLVKGKWMGSHIMSDACSARCV